MSETLKSDAERIADALLVNAFGDIGERLAIITPTGRNVGGWGRAAIIRTIQENTRATGDLEAALRELSAVVQGEANRLANHCSEPITDRVSATLYGANAKARAVLAERSAV